MEDWTKRLPGTPREGVSEFSEEFKQRILSGEYCHSHRDGDCFHESCPQNRDGEPMKTGRHCPLDWRSPDDEYFGV